MNLNSNLNCVQVQDLPQGDPVRERHDPATPEQEPQDEPRPVPAGVSQQDAAAAAPDDHQLNTPWSP
jgi:hypothetical protein